MRLPPPAFLYIPRLPPAMRRKSLEKYLHGPMKAKNLTDEVIDQRAAELAKAHHEAQKVIN